LTVGRPGVYLERVFSIPEIPIRQGPARRPGPADTNLEAGAVMSRTLAVAAVVLTALGSGGAAVAQDRAAPRAAETRPTKNPLEGNAFAISNGGAMFRNRCAGCHGPDAHGYLGPDLTGFWSAGGTDDRMFDIVRRGVPGTEMIGADPQRVLYKEIWQVLA